MQSLVTRTLTALSWALMLTVVFFAWHVSIKNDKLNESNREMKQALALARPHMVRNLDVDILPLVVPIETAGNISAPGGTRLIFVAEDGCGVCDRQMSIWKRLAEAAPRNQEIWMLSLDEGKKFSGLAAFLKANNRPYRWLKAADQVSFILNTGIAAVPATLTIKDQLVTMYAVGVFTDEVFSRVQATLNTPLTATAFPRNGQWETAAIDKMLVAHTRH
jgi:hypothetical protein